MLRKLRQKMRRAQDQKGFTLVELMVVVVILGILVTIAVPLYKAQTEKAKKATCFANQRMIESAIVQWSMDPDNENAGIPELGDLVEDGYLLSEPKCPSNNDTNDNDTNDTYNINPDGSVTCTTDGHNRVEVEDQ